MSHFDNWYQLFISFR